MISSSCPYFSSQTTYIHTHTLCSYKILALTSEQQINFYCLHRNIKKHTFFFFLLSQSSHTITSALTVLVALHWACSSVSVSFLHMGAPDWAQNSRYSLSSTKQPHKHQTEGKDRFPRPAGYKFPHAAQNAATLPCCHVSLTARSAADSRSTITTSRAAS